MRIDVDANFKLHGVFEPPCHISLGKKVTLKELLKCLDSKWASVHLMNDNELGDDVSEIIINGKHHFSLSKGLETPLNEKDNVWIELYMAPLGGG